MILVLLGTQDKPFKRLLEAVDRAIENKEITEKVIVQAGFTKYETKNMEMFELLPNDRYEQIISEANLIITHAGIGSILTGLKYNKKIIAAARLKEYKEHTNNHQLQILDELARKNFILRLDDFDKLGEVIKKSKYFVPSKYESNNKAFVKFVEDYIDSL